MPKWLRRRLPLQACRVLPSRRLSLNRPRLPIRWLPRHQLPKSRSKRQRRSRSSNRRPVADHLVAKPEAVSPSAGTATAEALQFEERIEGAVKAPDTDAKEGKPAPKPEQPVEPDSPPAKDPGGRKDYEWSELDTRWTRERRTFPTEKLLRKALVDEVLRLDRVQLPRPSANTVKAAIAEHGFNKFLETGKK